MKYERTKIVNKYGVTIKKATKKNLSKKRRTRYKHDRWGYPIFVNKVKNIINDCIANDNYEALYETSNECIY